MQIRLIGALAVSLAIALLMGPPLIRYLKKLHFGQTIYELGPAHQKKQGTPVMGGLMMAAGILAASLLFHPAEWVVLCGSRACAKRTGVCGRSNCEWCASDCHGDIAPSIQSRCTGTGSGCANSHCTHRTHVLSNAR